MAMILAPWLAIFIPFLFLRLLFRHFHCRRYNFPPGPKPWPVIGNLNLIGPIPHSSFSALSQKYGPIMHLKLGLKDFVVVSSADAAKAFLKTHGNTFSSRPKTTAGKYAAYNYSDILWAPYGPHWRQARKICFTQLLSQKCIESSECIRKEEMKNMLNELFISSGATIESGAIDTSSATIEWAMSEALKNPEILKKATEELGRVVGRDRWVEEKDIVNLPYIEAIAKESMRLHPASAVLPPTTSAVDGDSKVLGYDIPGGAQVIVNVWAIGRDPTIWENPNEFNPERFIGKDIDVIGHHFELLPFGAGRRICPGYALGLKVVQVSLANFVHGFSWSLPDHIKKEDLNMEENLRLSNMRKQPLEAVIRPKLSSHLYLP